MKKSKNPFLPNLDFFLKHLGTLFILLSLIIMTLVISYKIYFVFESKAEENDKTPKLGTFDLTSPSPSPLPAAPIIAAPTTCVPKKIGCRDRGGCIDCWYLTSNCKTNTKTMCNSCGGKKH